MKISRLMAAAGLLVVIGLVLSTSLEWKEIPVDHGRVAVLSPHFTQASAQVAHHDCAKCGDGNGIPCENDPLHWCEYNVIDMACTDEGERGESCW